LQRLAYEDYDPHDLMTVMINDFLMV